MGDRTVPFEEDAICDSCGQTGAFDFMGDYYCAECTKSLVNYDGTPVYEEEDT